MAPFRGAAENLEAIEFTQLPLRHSWHQYDGKAILDDWGLEPLDAQARHDLLEILEDRYGRRSTLITSQLRFVRKRLADPVGVKIPRHEVFELGERPAVCEALERLR